ncbi:DUF6603 domain-containing protein [Ramlibacter sp. AN1133]|uniref:DUF6603 domain-containing protein n=1 Tax=Ramlibacter sp. AN1133 TaxID=3133429 RepID=UPI0030C1B65E
MSDPTPFEQKLAVAAIELIAPLRAASESAEALLAYTQSLGWQVAAIDGLVDALPPLARTVAAVQALSARSQQQPVDVLGTLADLAKLGIEIAQAATALAQVRFPASAPAEAAALAGELAQDVMASLASTWLRRHWPVPRLLLLALGVLERRTLPALTLASTQLRAPRVREQLDFEQLGRWVTDPAAALRALGERYSTGGAGARMAEEAWNGFGPMLPEALQVAGLASIWLPADAVRGVPGSLWIFTAPAQLGDIGATAAAPAPSDEAGSLNAWGVLALEAVGPGVEVHVIPGGRWYLDRQGERWRAGLQASATAAITFAGAGVRTSGTASASATLATRSTPALRLGPAEGPGLAIGGIALGVASTMQDAQGWTLELSLDVTGIAVQVGAGGSDGFLAKVLASLSVPPFDLGVRWGPADGLRLSVGARASRVVLVKGLSLGPLDVRELALTGDAGPAGLLLTLDSILRLTLGPLVCTVTGLGLRLGLDGTPGAAGFASLRAGVKPPSGVAIKVDSGPVKGGGFIAFEPDIGRYSGALQLSVKAIDIAAIALVNTRLPDNPGGYSFLVILAAQFPSIPLGFGFALQGVGGIVGIHRRMDTEALKRRVSEGVLGSILFPRDPIGRIDTVLADLQSIFPIQEGRFVFGPMVKLSWGPSALLRLELAVVLDIPSPLRLAILGRMRLVLPTEKEAVADIRLEVVGVLDFDRQEATITAALVDSRLAGFTLTGDMAMVLGWGATKAFSLSMGGFFPGYPAPERMPANMRRLALALSSGDNPRLRFETYFAVTSNSVQFGAGVELYAGTETALGTFAVQGRAAFDALIEFEPFRLLCQLLAELIVSRNGVPLLMARLQARLSGPRPWNVVGAAEFELVVKVRVPFDVTVGTAEPPAIEEVDLRELMVRELARRESWAGVPAAGTGSIAVLKDAAPGDGLVLHPLGSVALVQRLLPFDKTILRYGGARPAGGPVSLRLAALDTGVGTSATPEPVLADFAPGQFEDLTEDEKLSRPAFEAMPAGGRAALPGYCCADRALSIFMNYAETVIDLGALQVDPAFVPAMPPLARPNSGLQAGAGVRISAERFVVADGDTLGLVGAGRGTSAAQAHDERRRLDATGRTGSVVTLDCETAA